MSVLQHEQLAERVEIVSFEDLQRGLGHLSLEDRASLDEKAREIFSEEAAAEAEYGPNSPQAIACDEWVLLYSCLESHPAIYNRYAIPAQRTA
jgi:hypothetical protein